MPSAGDDKYDKKDAQVSQVSSTKWLLLFVTQRTGCAVHPRVLTPAFSVLIKMNQRRNMGGKTPWPAYVTRGVLPRYHCGAILVLFFWGGVV